jgi:hypothetical protein
VDLFWLNTAFEVIDMRSFSNLWFWIALAVLWSTASHWVIGVPFDMVQRARRRDIVALRDVETLANIYARRINHIYDVSGMWVTGIVFFLLTTLALLGFVYSLEFAQAVFLLAAPMSLVYGISIHTSRSVPGMEVGKLLDHLRKHRVKVQIVGVVSIFTTSMWGMYTNLNTSVLGG